MNQNQMNQIVLVDTHTIFSEGVKKVFEKEEDFRVIGEERQGEERLQLISSLQPDVVLIDRDIPGRDLTQIIQIISQYSAHTHVILFVAQHNQSELSEALLAGVRGYLFKDMQTDALVEAVRVVAQGGAYIDPRALVYLLEAYKQLKSGEESVTEVELDNPSVIPMEYRLPYHLLTKRECEVLQMLAEGQSNRSIGELLFISEKTVKNHVSNILKKMEVQDRTQAVVEAIKNGWVKL